jgi:hypothetical protein
MLEIDLGYGRVAEIPINKGNTAYEIALKTFHEFGVNPPPRLISLLQA